jgi:hypothetical protein
MASLLEASPSRSRAASQNILKSRRRSCDVVPPENFWRLCLPEMGFSRDHGHLSKRSRSRRASRPGGGIGLTVSSEAVERLGPP